jgi:regulatory protein
MRQRWKGSASARSAGVLLSDSEDADAPPGANALEAEDPVAIRRRARESAVRILGRREHSQKELIRKLKQRAFDEAVIDETLAWLLEHGLLNEQRFSSEYVRSRIGRGYGPLRILQELRERGIDDEAAKMAMDAAEQDWWEAAAEVRHRKFGALIPTELSEIAKQQRFLQYRGFSAEHARAALRRR